MNKEINLPSGNYIFVEVPDDVIDFEILNKGFNRSSALLNICWNNEEKCIPYIDEKNPLKLYNEEDFKIISTTNNITEEQCENIVDTKRFEYEKYYENYDNGIMLFDTAKESLHSLIQANNLNIENNYLIIQKL